MKGIPKISKNQSFKIKNPHLFLVLFYLNVVVIEVPIYVIGVEDVKGCLIFFGKGH